MLFRFVLGFLLALSCRAQFPGNPIFCQRSTATATSDKLTLQQPVSGALNVGFPSDRGAGAYVECAGGCTVTLSRDGTAASSTAGTPVNTNKGSSGATTPAAKTWTASNVGSGTTISTFTLGTNGNISLALSGLALVGNGTAKNITVGHNNSSGAAVIEICWEEPVQ